MLLWGWSTYSDTTPSNGFPLALITGGAAATNHAGRFTGTGSATGGYGEGAVFNAAIDPTHNIYCVDVTPFAGVSFWIKAGSGAMTGAKVALNFIIPALNPAATQTVSGAPTTGQGDCQCTTAACSNCYNYPYYEVTLSNTWTQYQATFASTAGKGKADITGVIQGLEWTTTDANWDFSLDEIAFYAAGAAPTGPVGPPP
jgi:hypothetical protein